MALDINKACDYPRYGSILDAVIHELGGAKVLELNFETDYQGYVDISVLLESGEVWSYHYSYGSCSVCDEWEYKDLSDEEIGEVMKREATTFSSEDLWNIWNQSRIKEEPY